MKENKKALLREAQIFCDENDKSTEFMLQYMQDVAGVNLYTVIKFLQEEEEEKENDNK